MKKLLRHLRFFYSDYAIARDMDCVMSVADSDNDRAALRLYAKARRSAPGFQAHNPKANSHNRIPTDVLSNITRKGGAKSASTTTTECVGCRRPFVALRSDARTCSDLCRKRASRFVTLKEAI